MKKELHDLKREIESKYPHIEFVTVQEDQYLCLEFSTPYQRTYKFYVWVSADFISSSIGANLLKNSYRHYFWYYPYEHYNEDLDRKTEVSNFLHEVLNIITNCRTHIIQKKGVLFNTFICEYFQDNQWNLLYKHSVFNFGNFEYPKINGRKVTYE